MCVIVDNSVRDEVFGCARIAASQFFLDWLMKKGRLAIGGRLKDELTEASKFRVWLREAVLAGRVYEPPPEDVEAEETRIELLPKLRSNDPHVLALASVSGADLLYSNDRDLNRDFRDPAILGKGARRVYTTVKYADVRPVHRQLLRRTDLCQKCGRRRGY